jgi:outer membrane receptor protein involved in Fe transport
LNARARHTFIFALASLVSAATVLPLRSLKASEDDEDEDVLKLPEVHVEEEAMAGEEDAERFNLTPSESEDLDDLPGVYVTTEEILESTPSVRVKSFGSCGSPSMISLRGSDATHTLVLLDDIPLNDAASGLVDLSTIPSFHLESLSVLRGFSASAPSPFHPGGVVKFTSRKPEPGVHGEVGLRLGVYPFKGGGAPGSGAKQEAKPASSFFRFGALRQLTLASSVFNGRLGYLLTGSLEQGEGDFVYFSDNGTVYNRDDDRFLLRRNNHHAALSALLTLLYLPDMESELKLSLLEFDRSGGVAGLDVIQAEETRLHTGKQYLSLAYNRYSDFLDFPSFSARAYFKCSSIQWLDPLGEISNARQDSRSRSLGGGAGLSGYFRPGEAATILWGASAGVEEWDGEARYLKGGNSGQDVVRLSAGWNFTFFVTPLMGRLKLQGSLRLDFIGDRVLDDSEDTVESAGAYFLSPGAALEIRPWKWLALSASLSRNHRPATLIELFGNRGLVIGSSSLRPEQSVLFDAGAVVDLAAFLPVETLEVEYRFFNNRVTDLIAFIQNSQKTMVAQNIGGARINGFELILKTGFLRMVMIRLGYTFLDPRDSSGIEPYDGKMLPNRPRHDLFFDAAVTRWDLMLSYRMDFLSGGSIDRASLLPIAERIIHSASIEWEPSFLKGFYVGLEMWNLGNFIMTGRSVASGSRQYSVREAVADVDGYPLPGMAMYFSLGYKR